MKIFITGIAGFIGGHLADYFDCKGDEVFGIDNYSHASKVPFLNEGIGVEYGDVRYWQDLVKGIKKADLVFHMAAQINVDKSNAHPQETMDINLTGTANVLELCRTYNKPIVFASTSEVYGGHTEKINEGSPTYAQSPYAVSKLAADKLCGNYHTLYGTKVFRVRCFNTFGPYQSEDAYGAVIPKFARSLWSGKSFEIFGDGTQMRDFSYIDDVVRAYDLIWQTKELEGEPINVGSGQSISIINLAKTMEQLAMLGEGVGIQYVGSRPGEVSKLQADIRLLKSFGFKKQNTFRQGLQKYLNWFEEQTMKQL